MEVKKRTDDGEMQEKIEKKGEMGVYRGRDGGSYGVEERRAGRDK